MQKFNKNSMRKHIATLRNSLEINAIKFYSEVIVNKINKLYEYKQARHVGIYFACNNEVNLSALWQNNMEKQFYAPKIIGENLLMLPFKNTNDLIIGKYNILEPKTSDNSDQELDILFVPGLAFDKNCNRLGMGGGYYDKLLITHPAKQVIGVAFDFQIVDKIPTDPWDIKVDKVITCSIG
jgi:5-formyltetrahydrofolate cyclo-ligase